MKEYKLEFGKYYIDTNNFKQRNAEILVSMIGMSRLQEFMQFAGYAHIEFDESDVKHRYPIVTELEKFSRSKTNCIIYDLSDNSFNHKKFDKCFIYRSNNHKEPMFGFVMLNTETGRINHVYDIDELPDCLCQRFSQVFYTLYNDDMYNHYATKYDAVKERNGLTKIDVPSGKDFEEINEVYINQPFKIYNKTA